MQRIDKARRRAVWQARYVVLRYASARHLLAGKVGFGTSRYDPAGRGRRGKSSFGTERRVWARNGRL